ncbi:MAG TPA: hypothetical protein VFY90_07570, partial [Tepidiformaceae bacterium]|nr:hypothetical protein [Tepidiformaceae bacterium]
MSARLTVVLDDEDLYRRAKVWAAERGVPLKQVVESALRSYLGSDRREPPRFTREMWEQWQAES